MFRFFLINLLGFIYCLINFTFAQTGETYIYFCMSGDNLCENVDNFFVEKQLYEKYNIINKDISQDIDNLKDYVRYIEMFNIPKEFKQSIPFMVILSGENKNYIFGDLQIMTYFDAITGSNNSDLLLFTGDEVIVLNPGKESKSNQDSNGGGNNIYIFLFMIVGLGIIVLGIYYYLRKRD